MSNLRKLSASETSRIGGWVNAAGKRATVGGLSLVASMDLDELLPHISSKDAVMLAIDAVCTLEPPAGLQLWAALPAGRHALTKLPEFKKVSDILAVQDSVSMAGLYLIRFGEDILDPVGPEYRKPLSITSDGDIENVAFSLSALRTGKKKYSTSIWVRRVWIQ